MMGRMPPTLRLKANATARSLHGHPWVFGNEVTEILSAEFDGEVVECRDCRGHFLGTGIYNSRSQIVWRRLSWERVALAEPWLRGALQRAIARRTCPGALGGEAAGAGSAGAARPARFSRLVWSESDDLP